MWPDMRRDAALLSALLNDVDVVCDRVDGKLRQFTVKTLVAWTGKAEQTISQYRNGLSNIPIEFWRAVLEHHLDPRIVALLIPIDVRFELTIDSEKEPASSPEFFRQAIKSLEGYGKVMSYIAEMLADNRIDELDARTVDDFQRDFHAHRMAESALYRGICNTFNRIMERKAVARD